MIEAICCSETSVDSQRTTRPYIPEDGTHQNNIKLDHDLIYLTQNWSIDPCEYGSLSEEFTDKLSNHQRLKGDSAACNMMLFSLKTDFPNDWYNLMMFANTFNDDLRNCVNVKPISSFLSESTPPP
jgi:hypothetical protein